MQTRLKFFTIALETTTSNKSWSTSFHNNTSYKTKAQQNFQDLNKTFIWWNNFYIIKLSLFYHALFSTDTFKQTGDDGFAKDALEFD